MLNIYLDNSATTPLCDEAKKKILSTLDIYGNPSSLHNMGIKAEEILTDSRKIIARTLSCAKEEVFFTSCGSESNNLAIFGAVAAKCRKGNRIITTNSEHPSVLEPMKRLEEQGYEVIRLSTKNGVIDNEEFVNSLNEKTILVSIMHTNNETGAVYNINSFIEQIRRLSPEALIHCDFVQGYMKSFDIPKADLISISAHKIHAPKGAGVLYKRNGIRIIPQILGGGQENSLRSGTENIISIAAFAAAAEFLFSNLKNDIFYMNSLRTYLIQKLDSDPEIILNLPVDSSCNILSVALRGIKSEILLHFLSERGIFVSSGSACSSKKGKSQTLLAFGAENIADFTIRVSLSPFNTKEEIDCLCEGLKAAQNKIKRI